MEVITKQIETNQVEKRIFDQFMLDEDINVPDSKNDVARIVANEGRVRIDEIKPIENYLRVQGKIEYQILYFGEGIEPTLYGMEGSIPFVEMVYVEEGADRDLDVKNARAELQIHMIHSRKLRVKAMVEMELESQRRCVEEIPTDVECDCNIYRKEQQLDLLKLQSSKKDMYRIKEEITLPATKESIGMMLWTDVADRKLDTRLAADELQVTGELLVFCLYESPEGKIDWIEQGVPYQGRVDCAGIDETMYHHVEAALEDVRTDVRVDEDGEMRVIGIEGTLQLRIAVYEEEKVDVLQDMYSLEKSCVLDTREVEYEQLVLQNHSKCKVMERVSIPELRNEVLQICHSSGVVRIDKMTMREDGIWVEGALYISFLYVKASDEMPFDTWQGVVPFSHLIESTYTGDDLRYHISVTMDQLSITLQGGDEIEVKAAMAFHGFFKKVGKAEMICDARMEQMDLKEVEKRPSIVGYLVKEGDELWTLAKRFSTTVEAIKEMNEVVGDVIKAGERLLIFKENMSIL